VVDRDFAENQQKHKGLEFDWQKMQIIWIVDAEFAEKAKLFLPHKFLPLHLKLKNHAPNSYLW
jgi:hypothetical protein